MPSFPNPSLEIRPGLPDDATAIAGVINRAYQIERDFLIGDRTTSESVTRMLAEAGSTFLLMMDASGNTERLAGTVFVKASDARGYFGPLAVDPLYQGRGLGKRLVQAAEAHCRRRQCRHLDLDVLSLREELIAFYRGLAYEVAGTAAYPKPERLRYPAHLILMTKAL